MRNLPCRDHAAAVAFETGSAVALEDGKLLVTQGVFTHVSEEYWSAADGRVAVNLADLVSTKRYSDPHRLAGCCGLDSLDRPNLSCANGHEVGTEKNLTAESPLPPCF